MKSSLKDLIFILAASSGGILLSSSLVFAADAPVCYSEADLMHDLKYGNCQALGDHHPEDMNFCPEFSDKLKNNPQDIAAQFFTKISEGDFFAQISRCKASEHFMEKAMAANSVLESSVLYRYAKKCNPEGVIYARVFGAKEEADKKEKMTPSEVIKKEVDQKNIRLAVETDSAKSTALKKSIDQCAKTLANLAIPKFKLEDIRSLKFPTEAKVVLLKKADAHGLGDESIVRTISSVPTSSGVSNPSTPTQTPTPSASPGK